MSDDRRVTEIEAEARPDENLRHSGDSAVAAPPADPDRDDRSAGGALPQPGTELAGLQRPRAGAGRRQFVAAVGTRQVPGDLRLQPRRVLYGAGRRPQAPRRDGALGAL